MIIAEYLRKSRADDPGENIESTLQRHAIQLDALARERGYVVDHIYKEVVSGESLYARPQMLEMLEAVEQGRFDAVLCIDIDRLGRGGMKDQGIILETFKRSDTKIITLDHIYDLNDDTDEELTEFKTFMSRREYKIITKRLRRGVEQSVANGAYLSSAPYGYDKGRVGKIPSLIINPQEAEVVRLIFQMYMDGTSTADIVDHLAATGRLTRDGRPFGRSTIRYLIANPVYAGQVVWGKKHVIAGEQRHPCGRKWREPVPEDQWKIVPGVHEPIISADVFDRCQQIRVGRSCPSTVKSLHGIVSNPLSGLVYCTHCGGRMQRQGGKGKTPYLLCPVPGCMASAKMEYVEEALMDYLMKAVQDIDMELSADEQSSPLAQSIESSLQEVDRELERLGAQQDRLYTLLEQGVYSVEVFRERQAALAQHRLLCQTRRDSLLSQLTRIQRQDRRKLRNQIQTVLTLYPAADAKERNQLLKSILSRIDYTKFKGSDPKDLSLSLTFKTI